MRLVVVGNGMAGSRLVAEVRARSATVEVTVVGAEEGRPYNRVLLSDLLAGARQERDLRLVAPSWYDEHDVRVLAGAPVVRIDREARVIRTADGGREPYDLLVLATGSEPIVPPIPGVERALTFHSLGDCERVRAAVAGAWHAAVVGGGVLGVEVARGLAGHGLPVTLLHLGGHLMGRHLDEEAGRILGATLGALGVRARTGVQVAAVEKRGVRLACGERVEADLVVLACGVRPLTALAEQAGLRIGRGVVVDDEMRTSDPSILAVGECAEHEGTVYGLVAPAWEQAAVAAEVITGGRAGYRGSRRVTRLKARDVELAVMGEAHLGEEQAEVVRYSHHQGGAYRKLVIRQGRLVGAILLGECPTVGALIQLFDRGGPLPCDRAGLLFPGRSVEESILGYDKNRAKAEIMTCWKGGTRDVEAVAAACRATTGCGICRSAVESLIDWLAEQEEMPV